MPTIKRYKPTLDYSDCGPAPFDRPRIRMEEAADGEWVRWEEYRIARETLVVALVMMDERDN